MAEKYEVTDVKQITRYTTGGSEIQCYDIHIRTNLGATGYLRLKEVEYTSEKVAKKLEEFADKLNLAFNL